MSESANTSAPQDHTALQALIVTVEAQAKALHTIKQEVDALQISEQHRHRSWYQDAGVLVAGLALLFSFGTTAVSYKNSVNQSQQAARSDLRDLILQMGRLPREAIENRQRFAGNRAAEDEISRWMANESMILSTQASEIAQRIPHLVTASEHLYLGTMLAGSSLHDAAESHYERAAQLAQNIPDVTAAHRSLGMSAFIRHDLEAARKQYQQAKDVLTEPPFSTGNEVLIKSSDFYTEIYWSQAEASIGDCEAAAEHLQRARSHLSGIPQAFTVGMAEQIADVQQAGCQERSSPGSSPNVDAQNAVGSAGVPPPPAIAEVAVPTAGWFERLVLQPIQQSRP